VGSKADTLGIWPGVLSPFPRDDRAVQAQERADLHTVFRRHSGVGAYAGNQVVVGAAQHDGGRQVAVGKRQDQPFASAVPGDPDIDGTRGVIHAGLGADPAEPVPQVAGEAGGVDIGEAASVHGLVVGRQDCVAGDPVHEVVCVRLPAGHPDRGQQIRNVDRIEIADRGYAAVGPQGRPVLEYATDPAARRYRERHHSNPLR
jgi:hypothetical protein